MKKQILLICFLLFMVSCFEDCNNPVGPDDPDMYYTYEILYERILPIVNPSKDDPTGYQATFYHAQYGGQQSGPWQALGNEKWIAEIQLINSGHPYYTWLIDRKVVNVGYGEVIPAIARKLSMRLKGSGNPWVELTCIEQNGKTSGEWAKVIANNGPQNPSCY